MLGLVGVICEGREKYEGFWLEGKKGEDFCESLKSDSRDSGSAPGEEVAEMVAGVGAEYGAVSEGSQLVDSRSVLSGAFGIYIVP